MKSECLLDLLGDLNEDILRQPQFNSRCDKKDCTEIEMSNSRLKMWKQRFATVHCLQQRKHLPRMFLELICKQMYGNLLVSDIQLISIS